MFGVYTFNTMEKESSANAAKKEKILKSEENCGGPEEAEEKQALLQGKETA